MLGLPAFFHRKTDTRIDDDEIAKLAKDSSEGDEPPLPTELLHRLADSAEDALESGDKETMRLGDEDAARLRSQIVTVVSFLERYLARAKRYECKVRIQMTATNEASLRAKAIEAEG